MHKIFLCKTDFICVFIIVQFLCSKHDLHFVNTFWCQRLCLSIKLSRCLLTLLILKKKFKLHSTKKHYFHSNHWVICFLKKVYQQMAMETQIRIFSALKATSGKMLKMPYRYSYKMTLVALYYGKMLYLWLPLQVVWHNSSFINYFSMLLVLGVAKSPSKKC